MDTSKLILVFVLLSLPVTGHAKIVVPSGLADTAFTRAFDDALQRQDRDELITWNQEYDTPTPQQVHELFNNYTNVVKEDTTLKQGGTRTDTETWTRKNIPVALKIVEKFNSQGLLFAYEKKVAIKEN